MLIGESRLCSKYDQERAMDRVKTFGRGRELVGSSLKRVNLVVRWAEGAACR